MIMQNIGDLFPNIQHLSLFCYYKVTLIRFSFFFLSQIQYFEHLKHFFQFWKKPSRVSRQKEVLTLQGIIVHTSP